MSNPNEGKILIATPKVTNKIFQKTVIYIHTDDDTGAIGVMLNVPMDYDMATKWSQEISWSYPEKIYHGGPVERQIGYVLHGSDYAQDSTIYLNDHISYTGGRSIVNDINRGMGPCGFMLLTGYCQWQPKQLQTEIDSGMWMTVDFDPEFFFHDLDREEGWEFAINIAAGNTTQKLLDVVDSI